MSQLHQFVTIGAVIAPPYSLMSMGEAAVFDVVFPLFAAVVTFDVFFEVRQVFQCVCLRHSTIVICMDGTINVFGQCGVF